MYATYYELILLIITIITLFIQFYVIFLVQFRSPKSMAEYRYFLNIFSFYDMFFTILVGLFIQPYPITPLMGSAARGLAAYFGSHGAMITASIALFGGTCLLWSQDYCLLYRFTVLYNRNILHNFLMHPVSKVVCLIAVHVFSVMVGTIFYLTLVKVENIPFHLSLQPAHVTETLMPGESIILVDLHGPIAKPVFVLALIGFGLSELFSIGMVFLILKILKQNSAKFSKNTYRLHLQFTILLAVQLITPFFLIGGPLVGYLTLRLLNGQSKRPISELGFLMLTVYGSTNSIYTIVFVTPYREYTKINVIQPCWKPISHFLRKYSLLPKQSVVSAVYHKWKNSHSSVGVSGQMES